MNKKNISLIIGALIVVVILTGNPFYILYEGQQAVITQFGEPIGKPITTAGLKLKVPFIQKVNYFEKRILEWDGYPTQIPTKDKKYIWVDTTARWAISNPLKFFQSVYNERGGQARLDDIIDSAVRDAVTSHKLISIVRSSNRVMKELLLMTGENQSIDKGALEKISTGREEIRKEIIARARELVPQYGIKLVDVRIKRVSYIKKVRQKVYDRMIAERKRAAEQYRSEGRGISAEIEGKTEKELKLILSSAYKKSQNIKGEADAKVTAIYADAYNKDKDFYSFFRTLQTYNTAIDKNTILILTTDSDYFKYLKNMVPQESSFQK